MCFDFHISYLYYNNIIHLFCRYNLHLKLCFFDINRLTLMHIIMIYCSLYRLNVYL